MIWYKGQGLVEYALILVLVAVVVIIGRMILFDIGASHNPSPQEPAAVRWWSFDPYCVNQASFGIWFKSHGYGDIAVRMSEDEYRQNCLE